MSVNEKLAELCGMHKEWNSNCGIVYRTAEGLTMYEEDDWNPTTDLNQLKMCYEAAEKDDVFFVERLLDALMVLIRPRCACNIVSSHELTHAIFKRPELVAQAILKAKGVS